MTARRPSAPGSRLAGLPAAVLMMGWLSVVLVLDHDGSHALQRGLGLLTWLVLAVGLRAVGPEVRVQTGVVVAFATLVEFVFSPGLGVYTYRFDNVPVYVPPGHGLVYLSAYAVGHAPVVRDRLRVASAVVVVALGGWAGYGLLLASRPDVLGAFWFACLAAFLRWGPSRGVYVGAAVVVTWLELLGTRLGTWTWQSSDPTGWVPIGNPPTGAAGGYGWFDLAGLLAAPVLLAGWRRLAGRPAPPLTDRAAEAPQSPVRAAAAR